MILLFIVFIIALYFLIGFVFASAIYIYILNAGWPRKVPSELWIGHDVRFSLLIYLVVWPILLINILVESGITLWIKLLDKICLAIDNLKQEKGE